MSGIWVGVEFILGLIETLMIYFFCSEILDKKANCKWYHYFISNSIASILIFAATYVDVFATLRFNANSLMMKFFFMNIMILIYIFALFKGSFGKRISCYIVLSLLIIITDLTAASLVSSVTDMVVTEFAYTFGIERIIGFCIGRIIFVILTALISHIWLKGDMLIPIRHWYVFLIIYSILLIFGYVIMFFVTAANGSSAMLMPVIALCLSLLFMYFCTYYLFIKMNILYQKDNENKMMEYQKELIEKYVIQKEESDKIIQILSHDLKHNLLHWKQLAESKGYREVLKGITEYEQVYEENQLINVGNDIANAIINQKMLAARSKEIRFDIKGVFFEGLSVTSIDLCSLLGNLLDNAMEACGKVEDISKRRISFDIKRDGNFLFFEVSNFYEVEPVVKDNMFISKKRNRSNHGIGMISINSVVEKYEGAIEIKFQNDEFRTIIMLRAYE